MSQLPFIASMVIGALIALAYLLVLLNLLFTPRAILRIVLVACVVLAAAAKAI